MKNKLLSILACGLFVSFAPRNAVTQAHPLTPPAQTSCNPASRSLLNAYGQLPLSFEENRGQADARVRFLSRGANHTLFLSPDEMILGVSETQSRAVQKAQFERSGKRGRYAALRMKFVGANPAAQMSGVEILEGKSNYFIGNNAKNWHTGIPTYAKVRSRQIYPGIDLVYYGNQRELEYDLDVAPGADVRNIRLAIEGAKKLFVDSRGDAVLHSDDGEVRLRRPVIYQEANGSRTEVNGHYVIRGHEVRFQVGNYDSTRALVIDPVFVYSTYFGGTGSDGGTAIAVDAAGNAYVLGSTTFSNLPIVSGAQTSSGGGRDAFVAKLNAAGTALIYSTYLGGSSEDTAFGLAVDSNGSAYVTGATVSFDFPITAGAFQSTTDGFSAFAAKLSPDGGSLVYSTYLGGSSNNTAFGIAVDSSGYAYVVGETQSFDFPTPATRQKVSQPVLCDPTIVAGFDAFITKINPDGKGLAYSFLLGGSGTDRANAVAVDSAGNAYVAGNTDSTDFLVGNCPGPGISASALQSANAGANDAFLVKVNPAGTSLVFATYLGGAGQDAALGIAVDGSGTSYLTGESTSGGAGGLDAFIAKINNSGTGLSYFKYLGGTGFDGGSAIALDSSGNAYILGETSSTDFPVNSAIQSTYGGGSLDAFLAEFDGSGNVVFSTYLGGSGNDSPSVGGPGIAVDGSGNIYVTGSTASPNFPGVSATSFQSSNLGSFNAFIAKLAPAANNTPVSSSPGAPVSVSLGGNAVQVTFAGGVTQGGQTTLTSLGGSCPAAPGGFQFGTPAVCYDITTTAQYSGAIQVCISDPSITASSVLLHFTNGSWNNITTSITPPTICGTDSSLSPFAVAHRFDTAPPVTKAQVSPLPNAAGWNNSNVTVNLTATDNVGGSGVAQLSYSINGVNAVVNSSSTSFVLTSEGITTITYFATDNAGNVEALNPPLVIKVDKTPPSIMGAGSPAPNVNGWNNSPVTASFTCSDALSGLAAGSPPAPTTLLTEGLGQSVTGSCFDIAGNMASAKLQGINIDLTPPVVTAMLNPPANANGWNNTNVTVSFAATDNLSGVASVTAPVSFTNEGKNQAVSGMANDLAGNVGAANVLVNIDKTAPEAYNQFDLATHDVVLFGRDSLSGVAPGPVQPASVVALGTFGSIKTELRTYSVLDLAGNALRITERVLHGPNLVAATIVSLQYGQGAATVLPFNLEGYGWVLNSDGSLRALAQTLQAGPTEEDQRFDAIFTSLQSQTSIEQEEPEPENNVVKPGLALLRMATSGGKLAIEF